MGAISRFNHWHVMLVPMLRCSWIPIGLLMCFALSGCVRTGLAHQAATDAAAADLSPTTDGGEPTVTSDTVTSDTVSNVTVSDVRR